MQQVVEILVADVKNVHIDWCKNTAWWLEACFSMGMLITTVNNAQDAQDNIDGNNHYMLYIVYTILIIILSQMAGETKDITRSHYVCEKSDQSEWDR